MASTDESSDEVADDWAGTEDGITYRTGGPEDDEALDRLYRESPDGGQVPFVVTPVTTQTDAFARQGDEWDCVVAEADGRLVGAGAVSYRCARWAGGTVDAAELFALAVLPSYRRRGIGTKLTAARIALARDRIGSSGVVYWEIQDGNAGSRRVHEPWGTPGECPLVQRTIPTRPTDEPSAAAVREAKRDDYERLVAGANRFYADYALTEPLSVDLLADRLSADRGWSAYVARDGHGEVVGGTLAHEQYRAVRIEVGSPPDATEIRPVELHGLWHAPGYESAVSHVVEALRDDYADEATSLSISVDERSSLHDALPDGGRATTRTVEYMSSTRLPASTMIGT